MIKNPNSSTSSMDGGGSNNLNGTTIPPPQLVVDSIDNNNNNTNTISNDTKQKRQSNKKNNKTLNSESNQDAATLPKGNNIQSNNNNQQQNGADSDSDTLSTGSTTSDASSGITNLGSFLKMTNLRKVYKSLKKQQKEDLDLVQSDASQSESETGYNSGGGNRSGYGSGSNNATTGGVGGIANGSSTTTATVGLKPFKSIHPIIKQQQTVSQVNRLVCMNRPSLLSRDSDRINSYRGFINLGIIILVVSHLRLMLINLQKYGILLNTHEYIAAFLRDPSNGWPVIGMFFALNIFLVLAYGIEKIISIYIKNKLYSLIKKKESEKRKKMLWKQIVRNASLFSFCCYFVLLVLFLTIYIGFVWFSSCHPVAGMILTGIMTIVFLKLTSYAVVNDHLREKVWDRREAAISSINSSGVTSSATTVGFKQYPNNITLNDIYYFMLAPTLVYEEHFPRTKSIRIKVLLGMIGELILCTFLLIFIVEQYMVPLVENSMEPLSSGDVFRIFERLLKLTVPNIVVWVIGFYAFFHLSLNIMAELLKFGDRLFYLDWWNCTDMSYFWRTWNLPVHKWLVLHVYLPLVNHGFSASFSSFVVFFVSALFHELVVSVPFRNIKLWAFFAMVIQMPMIYVTKKYFKGKQMGNVIFWASFMFGQSNCILLYYFASQGSATTQPTTDYY
ncbi:hypothetical protein ABK040_001293 [Willaertia magna]